MAFFKYTCTIAAATLLMLLSLSVSVSVSVASSVAEVPSGSPSPSPSPEDGKYALEKLKELKKGLEEFISKGFDEWQNDPTSNSWEVCLNDCTFSYQYSLLELNKAIVSASEGDFRASTRYLGLADASIKSCSECFDKATSNLGTVYIPPDSMVKFSSFASALAKQCYDNFAEVLNLGPGVTQKDEDEKYALEKMKELKKGLEEFISKDFDVWQNDPTSNSKEACMDNCKSLYDNSLHVLNESIVSVSEGDFGASTHYLGLADNSIKGCSECFDKATWNEYHGDQPGTVFIRPDSIDKFTTFATALAQQCFDMFVQYGFHNTLGNRKGPGEE